MSGIDFCLATQHVDPPWIVNTGGTNHMICSPRFFTRITAIVSHAIRLPNSNSAVATHVGDVFLTAELSLKNVLCVPTFPFNLIFAKSLPHGSNCCLFFIFFTHVTFRTFPPG